MTARRFQTGDAVAMPTPNGQRCKATVEGVVVAYADLAGPRQKLWVRGPDNRIHMAVVDLVAIAGANEPTGRLCGPPVDLPSADILARLILNGRNVRLPIEVQLTTLATALLQAERPKQEGETT